MTNYYDAIVEKLGGKRVLINEPMSYHTTIKIGGPADYYYQATTNKELVEAVSFCRQQSLSYFLLAGGSKILVGDLGIRGLVVHNKTTGVEVLSEPDVSQQASIFKTQPRFEAADPAVFMNFADLDYDETALPPALIKVDSGVMMPTLINHIFTQGITGLEWFVRIPATMGGGIFMNMHGANRFLGDKVVRAEVLTSDGRLLTVDRDYFQFDYDKSSLQENGDILLTVTIKLYKGDVERAKKVAMEWAKRKSKVQSANSAGSVFRNLSAKDQNRLNLPTPSAGFVIDKLLGLKGRQVGQAQISPKHANFIVNLGGSKAKEVMELITLCKTLSWEKLGLDLVEEIVYAGEFQNSSEQKMDN